MILYKPPNYPTHYTTLNAPSPPLLVSSCEPDETSVTGLVEDNSYSVFVSFIEIYNNYIYDLLEGNSYDNLIGIKFVRARCSYST